MPGDHIFLWKNLFESGQHDQFRIFTDKVESIDKIQVRSYKPLVFLDFLQFILKNEVYIKEFFKIKTQMLHSLLTREFIGSGSGTDSTGSS